MTASIISFYPALYLIIPVAFLMGSIPFGLLFTRGKGVDLRATGSKNIGATNVLRTAGKLPAVLTLLCDTLKGAAPVLVCDYLISGKVSAGDTVLLNNAKDLWGGLVGFAAVAGHIFSVFLSFRGGKGVATGLGVLIAYSPVTALVSLLIWTAVAVITRYSSLAAIVAVGMLPVTFALLEFSGIKISFGVLLAILIVYKHRENISRLFERKEPKIGGKGRS
ncbi:MAG: glycerol-3-phosphate 1-O-acyltransferase [Nitrospiraceae bacterium]|nr:MAG: glycerol-3-phosphate 1-O-acyltransferase [Nitrospiraceae bacterium]